MKFKIRLILVSTVALLLGLIITYLLRPYLPDFIPNTPLPVDGLILVTLIVTTSIVVSKHIFRKHKNNGYLQIIMTSVLVVVCSEFIFQVLRQFTMESDSFNSRLITIGKAILTIGILSAIVSLLTAFHLKTKKTGHLVLLIIGVFIGLNILLKAFNYK